MYFQLSLTRSLSISSHSECSTDSGSDIETTPQQCIQSVPTVPTKSSGPTRCVVTAKFELELDGNVMSATTQPCVHKSPSKHHHNNRQPKRHKRHHNTRY